MAYQERNEQTLFVNWMDEKTLGQNWRSERKKPDLRQVCLEREKCGNLVTC